MTIALGKVSVSIGFFDNEGEGEAIVDLKRTGALFQDALQFLPGQFFALVYGLVRLLPGMRGVFDCARRRTRDAGRAVDGVFWFLFLCRLLRIDAGRVVEPDRRGIGVAFMVCGVATSRLVDAMVFVVIVQNPLEFAIGLCGQFSVRKVTAKDPAATGQGGFGGLAEIGRGLAGKEEQVDEDETQGQAQGVGAAHARHGVGGFLFLRYVDTTGAGYSRLDPL